MGKLFEKNVKKFFFTLTKLLKKGVGSGVESGSAPTCHGSPTLPLRLIWLFDDAVQAVIGIIWSETV